MSDFSTLTRKVQQDKLCLLKIYQADISVNGTFYCLLLNEGLDYMGNGTVLTVVGKYLINVYNKYIIIILYRYILIVFVFDVRLCLFQHQI